jgi:hypothetical protein
VSVKPDKSIYDYFKGLNFHGELDYDSMTFYFLVNVVRYDYTTTNFKRVKKIGAYLIKNYNEQIKGEPSVYTIIRRAQFIPHSLISFARNIKRRISERNAK